MFARAMKLLAQEDMPDLIACQRSPFEPLHLPQICGWRIRPAHVLSSFMLLCLISIVFRAILWGVQNRDISAAIQTELEKCFKRAGQRLNFSMFDSSIYEV